MLDAPRLQTFVGNLWDEAITPTLVDYIRIPNKSPAFDPQWAEHGYMEEAVTLLESWARARLCRNSPARRWRWCAWRAARR